MKKIKLLLITLFGVYAFTTTNTAYGFSIVRPASNTSSLNSMSVSQFVKLSPKEFSAITGQKLNFFQRLSFKATQAKMKRDLKKNPDLKLTDYAKKVDRTFQVDILWLLLGTLLGPIGVLIAYVTKAEQYKLTSAWIGFGIFVLILILFGKSIF